MNPFAPKHQSEFLDAAPMNQRRDAFYAKAREAMVDWVNPDGSPRESHHVFAGTSETNTIPNREPFRSLPCLYSGEQRHVDLANAMVARYCRTPPPLEYHPPAYVEGDDRALRFNIFQSNNAAAMVHKYRERLSPEAARVLEYHSRLVFEHCPGSAQIDYCFHGCNDNMPAMSTVGLILGGEALGDDKALAHGLWKLKRFRRILSRNAWASEYNSGTYSAITLTSMAKIAAESRTPEARELALAIEERLWAEMLLHWHPGTFCQAGPHSRAYAVDAANHMHNQHALLWLAFGSDATRRDLIKTCFEHDGVELVHFDGYHPANIAEYVEVLDADLHVPEWLANLVDQRSYPVRQQGVVEQMNTPKNAGGSGRCHTTTYMEKSFSLGTVDSAFCGGDQTDSLYATYRRQPNIRSFKDAGVLFARYLANDATVGTVKPTSHFFTGPLPHFGENYVASQGNMLTLQKDGTAMLLAQPHCRANQALCEQAKNEGVSSLKLSLIMPTHYGKSQAVIVGDEQVEDFCFRCDTIQPISIDTGDVYIHINPLVPTSHERDCAIELVRENAYEAIHLINYRGPARTFTSDELARMFNGCIVTLRPRADFAGLDAFHRSMRKVRIHDYWAHLHYVLFQRDDVELEMVTSIQPMSAQTLSIDGRTPAMPTISSSEIAVERLPFLTGPVPRDEPFFPWKNLSIHSRGNNWGIGTRGLPGEQPYSDLQDSSNP
jgi:hypothetical protein